MDVILIAGLWLRAPVWDETAAALTGLGHRPVKLALPGVDHGSQTATLEDQVAAVLQAVDASDRPWVVGHSAAASLAWIAADRRPSAVGRVVLIGGFPAQDGSNYADFFEPENGVMPFPGWEEFAGPDSADLDLAARERMDREFVPVSEGVSRGIVRLVDERRFGVPVTVVCPEFSAEDAKAWLAAGEIPELGKARDLSFVDIDSGHWPMITRSAELARLIHSASKF